jgi:hypothetical protein
MLKGVQRVVVHKNPDRPLRRQKMGQMGDQIAKLLRPV